MRFRYVAPVAGLILFAGVWLMGGCAQTPTKDQPEQEASAPSAPDRTSGYQYPAWTGPKKRLAVLGLENKVRTKIPNASWNLGEGLTEMLITELLKTGRFIMVERQALADIVKEQELGQTGLVRQETAAKVGELLGAQLLVAGAVTEFEAASSGGGGGVGFRGMSLAVKTKTAHVGVDIRMVDASTGEIVNSHYAAGKARSTGVGFGAMVQGVRFGSDAFFKTPLGKATRQAIHNAVMFIVDEMEVVPWTGRVVTVKGRRVYVNAGRNANLMPGMELSAYSLGELLKDPDTGLTLGAEEKLVGKVTLRRIQKKFSVGIFEGEAPLKRGDLLTLGDRPPPSRPRGGGEWTATETGPSNEKSATEVALKSDASAQASEGGEGDTSPGRSADSASTPQPPSHQSTHVETRMERPVRGTYRRLGQQQASLHPPEPTVQRLEDGAVLYRCEGFALMEIPRKFTWGEAKGEPHIARRRGDAGGLHWRLPSREEVEQLLTMRSTAGPCALGEIRGTYWTGEKEERPIGNTMALELYVTVVDWSKGDFFKSNETIYPQAHKVLLIATSR